MTSTVCTRFLALVRPAVLRSLGCFVALALLGACAGQGPEISATQQAEQYAAHARGNYVAPGPPEDPWGPYIQEASKRFDVPQRWIRSVMDVESGAQEYQSGHLIISSAGAMGLMQVMPQTYQDLQGQYNLGPDPYDPHDNILAGAAYLREMYDIYGMPGCLAAYNAGPRRLDDYLSNQRPLPDETRHYVAMIAPTIEGIYPTRRSAAESYAMNDLPMDIPPGLRYGGMVRLASARHPGRHGRSHDTVRVARLAEPPRQEAPGRAEVAMATESATPRFALSHTRRRGFHLIEVADAEPAPRGHGGSPTGGWAVQVGAFGRQGDAEAAVSHARAEARGELAVAHPTVASVHQAHAVLWRARLTGLSREAAIKACAAISHGRKNCIVLSPDAQS